MANTFSTSTVVLNETLDHLENDLVLGGLVHADYSNEFQNVGDTISIRRPPRFSVIENNLDITGVRQDVTEGTTDIKLDQTLTIPVAIGTLERTLDVTDERIQDFVKNMITPMKDTIESKIAGQYVNVWNTYGTPGTAITTRSHLGKPYAYMTDLAVPTPRCAVHNPYTGDDLADLVTTTYDDGNATSGFREARIGRIAQWDNYVSVHTPNHTVGALGGTPLVNGGSQGTTYEATKGSPGTPPNRQSLVTDGWSNSVTDVLKAGDVFTIAGVNSVNPISKASTGRLQEFVVVADADSDGSGNATLTISPAIIATGAYQNVSAAPADNAAITVKGSAGTTYRQSLGFHKSAFALTTRMLKIPKTGNFTTKSAQGNRMSLSISEGGNFDTLSHDWRIDCLYAVNTIYPDMAIRLWGEAVS